MINVMKVKNGYDLTKNIPDELKITKNWVCVKFEKDENGDLILSKNGKPIKVPYQINDKKAQSNNSKTWTTFDKCLNKFKINSNNDIEGLGYVLSLEDDYIFIDVDDMHINTEEKKEFISRFNTYIERSQSGKGYHIIVKVSNKKKFEQWAKNNNFLRYGTEKKTLSSKKGGYEIYINSRYFWLTGDIVDNQFEINKMEDDDLKEVFEFIDSHGKSKTKESKESKKEKTFTESPEMSNEEIIKLCKKAKNSEKFLKLYNEIGKDGNSESDQTLMNMLAFYTQDIEQLCELFRESPRYRGKFDIHPRYLEMTAQKAVNLLKATYQKGFYKNSDVETVLKQGAILPEDMTELPWIFREEINNKGKIKTTILCPELEKFLVQNGDFLFVKYGLKSMINRFLYKDGCYRLITDSEFKGYIKKYIPHTHQNTKAINEVMQLIYMNDCYVNVNEINPEKYINFQNGLFNIKTWKMEEHTPKVYTTIQIPCDYNPDLKPLKKSVFDKYLEDLTEGKEEIKKILKQFMGITISNVPGYRMKKSLFMVGKGDTGKTQLKELLAELIGEDNVDSSDLPDLEKRFGTHSIYGKRLIGSNDMGYIKIKELRVFKLATGGDKINFEFKHEGTFTDKFYGVIWNCANEMPKFGGDKGDWTYDRMVIVRCNNVIPELQQNKTLVEDMYCEREYIIWQMMNSLKEVLDNGFRYDIPQSSYDALEEYKISNDSILLFMQDCTEIIEDEKLINTDVTMSMMYKVYKQWCKDNNNGFCETKQTFKKLLDFKNLGEFKKKNGGIRYYSQFILNEDAIKDYTHFGVFDN